MRAAEAIVDLGQRSISGPFVGRIGPGMEGGDEDKDTARPERMALTLES